MLHEKKWILSQGVSKPIGWCLDVLLSCTSTVWVELRHHIVPRMFKTHWMMFGCLIVLYFHGLSWVETPHCPKDIQNPLDDVSMSYCLVLPRFELRHHIVPRMFKTRWMMFWCLVVLYFHGLSWVETPHLHFELRHHIYILDRRRSCFQFQTNFLAVEWDRHKRRSSSFFGKWMQPWCAPLCVL